MSVAITIRDVPDDVRAAIAEKARERGQSMQQYLQQLLRADVAHPRNNNKLIAEIVERNRRRGTRVPPDWIVKTIREHRDSH
jgi:plasmid stability protein